MGEVKRKNPRIVSAALLLACEVVLVVVIMFTWKFPTRHHNTGYVIDDIVNRTMEQQMVLATVPQQESSAIRIVSPNGTEWKSVKPNNKSSDMICGPHKLAVVIPFRDCHDELRQLIPHMNKFLSRQEICYHFYVMNQVDNYRFNRASLINIGYDICKKDCDYFAMHDVDLLPMNNNLSYRYKMVLDGPHHISSNELHPDYHYRTFIGGILLMKNKDFELVNGFSNMFWGWGREDDDLYSRIQKANLKISRPKGINSGYRTFKHIHRPQRKRERGYLGKARRDPSSGLTKMLSYNIQSTKDLSVNGTIYTLIDVELKCNISLTPWCVHHQ